MHLTSIIWYLTWPALIYVSYRIILCSVKKFEKKQAG
jgi:hypothetical protein